MTTELIETTHKVGQEIVPRPKPTELNTVKALLSVDAYKHRFAEVMGDNSAQFMASISNLATQKHLAACNPQSVIASAFIAATLDLPIDKNLGFAHIVPYKGVAQFQMGYKGFIQLAQRSGLYLKLSAVVVPEGVFTSYDELKDELILEWDKKTSEKPIGYACYFKLLSGFEKTVYWSKTKVENHAMRYSAAYKAEKKDSPWFTNFDSMALKTVIKSMLSHWGPLSVALRRAMEVDQASTIDINSEEVFMDAIEPDEPVAPDMRSKSDQVADLIGGSK